MREEQLVQFVCFETILDTTEFIAKWKQFTRLGDSFIDITVQQSKQNGLFRYIVQHRGTSGQFQFIFEKAKRSSKTKEVLIRAEQVGGYSISQVEKQEPKKDESKLFVFLNEPLINRELFSQLTIPNKLNIYEAYYENCRYACILEFFTKDKLARELLNEMKNIMPGEAGIYKGCLLPLSNQPVLH